MKHRCLLRDGPVSPNRPINTGPVSSSLGGGEGLVQRRKSQADGPQTLGSPAPFESEPRLAKSGSLITEPAATHSTDDPDQSPKKVVQPETVPTVGATATPHPAKAEVLTVPADVRSAVTSVMGSSPNSVTVHRGTGVQQKADALNADAFTQNGEVHIPGDLPLTSSPMKRLLAHELTHVVQQHGQLNTKSENSPLGQLLENQALEVETAHSTADAIPVTLPTLQYEALAPARDQKPVHTSSSHSHSFMPSSRGGEADQFFDPCCRQTGTIYIELYRASQHCPTSCRRHSIVHLDSPFRPLQRRGNCWTQIHRPALDRG